MTNNGELGLGMGGTKRRPALRRLCRAAVVLVVGTSAVACGASATNDDVAAVQERLANAEEQIAELEQRTAALEASLAAPASAATTEPIEVPTPTPTPVPTATPPAAPVPALPDAPWATEPVPAPRDVARAAAIWRELRDEGLGWDCALLSPTELNAELGFDEAFEPVATRTGSFVFGFADPSATTATTVSMNMWPLDSPNVDAYFADDVDREDYSDGSVRYRLDQGWLFAIPAQECFYEMTITDFSTVVAGWAFDSLRIIEGTNP